MAAARSRTAILVNLAMVVEQANEQVSAHCRRYHAVLGWRAHVRAPETTARTVCSIAIEACIPSTHACKHTQSADDTPATCRNNLLSVVSRRLCARPLQVLPAVYLFVGRSLNATPVQLGTLTLCRAMVQVRLLLLPC